MSTDNYSSKRFKLTGEHFDYSIINAQSVAVERVECSFGMNRVIITFQ